MLKLWQFNLMTSVVTQFYLSHNKFNLPAVQSTFFMLCFTQRTLLSWPLAEKVNDELISVLNSWKLRQRIIILLHVWTVLVLDWLLHWRQRRRGAVSVFDIVVICKRTWTQFFIGVSLQINIFVHSY